MFLYPFLWHPFDDISLRIGPQSRSAGVEEAGFQVLVVVSGNIAHRPGHRSPASFLAIEIDTVVLLPAFPAEDKGKENTASVSGDELLSLQSEVAVGFGLQGRVNGVSPARRIGEAGKRTAGNTFQDPLPQAGNFREGAVRWPACIPPPAHRSAWPAWRQRHRVHRYYEAWLVSAVFLSAQPQDRAAIRSSSKEDHQDTTGKNRGECLVRALPWCAGARVQGPPRNPVSGCCSEVFLR